MTEFGTSCLACLHARLLDHYVRSESDIDRKNLPATSPDATAWLNLTGSLLNGSHEEARDARRHFARSARKLRDAAEEAEDLELRMLLGEEESDNDPGRALAEALSAAFTGSSNSGTERLNNFLSSTLMIDEVNGLGKRRKVMLHQTRRKGQGRTGVRSEADQVPVRDWLCQALAPLANRDCRRTAMIAAVRSELVAKAEASDDGDELAQQQNDEVKARILRSGRTNVSRAVSDLVRAGLLHRHYQGYRVDHPNRGAQREAVYTIAADVRLALASGY